jgi:putative membrane protein
MACVHTDYRFTLANERTFLAYLRTALALDGAALAVAQFLDLRPAWLAPLLAIVLAAAGLSAGIGAMLRWRANARAIEAGRPLPATVLPVGLALTIAGCSVIALALVFGR